MVDRSLPALRRDGHWLGRRERTHVSFANVGHQAPGLPIQVADADAFRVACCLAAMFWATTQAAAAMTHEMKKAVQGRRVCGAAMIAGPQTSRVKRLIMSASVA